MTNYALRQIHFHDINYLVDIDLKSFEYPWSPNMFRRVFDEPTVFSLLVACQKEPVGFIIWQRLPSEARILRLAVKPSYRCLSYGTRLLRAAELAGAKLGLTAATILVPEIHCFPGHPHDVSQWLSNRGYEATGEIVKNCMKMYGESIDCIRFVTDITYIVTQIIGV